MLNYNNPLVKESDSKGTWEEFAFCSADGTSCTATVCELDPVCGSCGPGCTPTTDSDCSDGGTICISDNGCCGIGCSGNSGDSNYDSECPLCVSDGNCNGICPLGCGAGDSAIDSDCGCVDNNSCCGAGCGYYNDNNCSIIAGSYFALRWIGTNGSITDPFIRSASDINGMPVIADRDVRSDWETYKVSIINDTTIKLLSQNHNAVSAVVKGNDLNNNDDGDEVEFQFCAPASPNPKDDCAKISIASLKKGDSVCIFANSDDDGFLYADASDSRKIKIDDKISENNEECAHTFRIDW